MEIEFTVKITPEEKRQHLASALAATSAILLFALLLGLFYLPLSLFATLAYLPLRHYRKILLPRRLTVESSALIYTLNNKKILILPFASISHFEYSQGIGVFLKKPPPASIQILEPALLTKHKPYDFYFEWFEPKACSLLQQHLRSSK